MNKYTIAEFGKGLKAVKIDNKDDWEKLDKVYPLTSYYYGPCFYCNKCKHDSESWFSQHGFELLDFQQIDFEEAEKYIIGYKFKEQYLKYQKQAAEIGDYNTHYDVQEYYLTEKRVVTKNAIKLLKEAGVFDIWFEPVYKSEKPTLPEGFTQESDKKISFGHIIQSYDWWKGVGYASPCGTMIGDENITDLELEQLIKYINYQEKNEHTK